jgi:hypothetical protein
MVHRGDIRCRRGYRHSEVPLDQMLGKRRCVRGASPGAGHNDVWSPPNEPLDERGERLCENLRLQVHGRGCLVQLIFHTSTH